jgi:hypothetical protein
MADKLDKNTRTKVSSAGGLARAAKLSPERRSEIARKAAMKRFYGADDKGEPAEPSEGPAS